MTKNGSEQARATDAKLTLVLPVAVKQELERLARQNDRSVSAEARRALTGHCMGLVLK